jgi:prepilin-type N-terminal cleavage/methylation domain-containing protein
VTRDIRRRRSERGFTMVEVMVSLAIVSLAVVGLHAALATSAVYAQSAKVNRQLRHLAAFQYGQVLVGKIHPDEQDPFLDGQTGAFEDVGGYREEYEAFDWRVESQEVALEGGMSDELLEAGFYDDGSGVMARPFTDDVAMGGAKGGGFASLLQGESVRPEGRYARRIKLVIRYTGADAASDREFTMTTLVGIPDLDSGGDGAPLPGGAAGGGQPQTPADGRSGGGGVTELGGGDRR